MLPSPGTVLGLDPLGLGVPGLCSPQVPREAPWGCAGLLRAGLGSRGCPSAPGAPRWSQHGLLSTAASWTRVPQALTVLPSLEALFGIPVPRTGWGTRLSGHRRCQQQQRTVRAAGAVCLLLAPARRPGCLRDSGSPITEGKPGPRLEHQRTQCASISRRAWSQITHWESHTASPGGVTAAQSPWLLQEFPSYFVGSGRSILALLVISCGWILLGSQKGTRSLGHA